MQRRFFPRNANKGQHGELSDAMRNFRNSMAEANACTKGGQLLMTRPLMSMQRRFFPRNANKGQHGELSDVMRNFRNSMAEANACTKGETAPYDTPSYEHAAGLFPAECE
ncbi:hypothetical protein GCWU000341_01325 [Oribacterium sp. oral taxon 078 str. F0262]|nr:hypothetical protein GCWU000341_01325 [Oribacterium sp. oral taxon 078 str. F0262]